MPATTRVVRLSESNRADFFRLHCDENDCGWCNCVAWWVPTWEGWGERSAEQNRALRNELFDRGEFDGYLLYEGDVPAASCQAGPRDRLEKLVHQRGLHPNPRVWAITCFTVRPDRRGRGCAAALLKGVLADLKQRGVDVVQAFPKRGDRLPEGEAWTGPERLFLDCGFNVVEEDESSPVLELTM